MALWFYMFHSGPVKDGGKLGPCYALTHMQAHACQLTLFIWSDNSRWWRGETGSLVFRKGSWCLRSCDQGCQFCFGRCFIFSIGIESFSFRVFRRAISGLYYSYIYIYIYIYSTNIIQIQDKLIINYSIQTQYQTNIISKFKIFLNSQD
jgi:hypothetical protein